LNEIIQVVCAIIEKGGKFLAARKATGLANEGLWEFPGGKINKGESPEQALIREIKEEIDIEIKIQKCLSPVIYRYPEKSIQLIPFICTFTEGSPKALEHEQIVFVNDAEALKLDWAPADIPVLKEYIYK
jgi:8-oxo-dGTP diphosphatase